MEQLGKLRHRREDQRLSEREVSESNLSFLIIQRFLGFARNDRFP